SGWPIRSRVVAVTSQNVGRAAAQRGCATGVGRGCTSWVKEKITLSDGTEVARNIPVLSFTFIGQATVHARIVDLLGERFGVGDTTTHRPGPAIHRSITRIHEVIQGHEIRRHAVEAGRDELAKES